MYVFTHKTRNYNRQISNNYINVHVNWGMNKLLLKLLLTIWSMKYSSALALSSSVTGIPSITCTCGIRQTRSGRCSSLLDTCSIKIQHNTVIKEQEFDNTKI